MSITVKTKVTSTKGVFDQRDFPTQVGTPELVKASEIFKKYKPYYANRGEGLEEIDQARVNSIAKSIIGEEGLGTYNGTFWLVNPIIVRKKQDKQGVIVDGHYTAAALNRVYDLTGWDLKTLVIEREFPKSLSDREIVTKFNNCRKPWPTEAYIKCYMMEGNQDYIKLDKAARDLGGPFVKKNNKPNYRYVSALLGIKQGAALKSGKFVYDPIIAERGERVKELFYAISKTRQTSAWFESFIVAYCKQEETNRNAFKVFMKNADKFVLDGCTNDEGWTEQFNRIWDMVL